MRPFLIWFQHRSGSTHLVSLLNSHPHIKCKGEIFGCYRVGSAEQLPEFPNGRILGSNLYRRVVNQFPGRIEDPSDETSVDELNGILSGNVVDAKVHRIPGFKFKFPSQAKLFPEITDRVIQSSENINLIVLTRKNLLKRAVSVVNLELVQRQTNQANVNFESVIKPIDYDAGEIVRLMNYYETIDVEFIEWSRLFLNVIHVDYEELVTDEKLTCARIQEFLGVPHKNLHSKTKKITPSDLSKQILNFDEIREAMCKNNYGHFLDQGLD